MAPAANNEKSGKRHKIKDKKETMKTITAVKWMAALILAGSLAANAQGPEGAGIDLTNGAAFNQGQAGSGGHHQRPSPEQMAKRLMEKFDANKVGELSQDELTQALEFLRKQPRPQQAGGGQPGGPQSGIQLGGQQGSVQLGTGQGGSGGQRQDLRQRTKLQRK